MRHALIMAGGAGTRLWPLSRQHRPKHFLQLFEGKSLMRIAFERLVGLLPAENIWVITRADHGPAVARELPELPAANIIGEPAVRDTANAVGLAAVLLAERDPEGLMGVFTADHVIRPIERFHAAVSAAFDDAARHADALITLGVPPRSPHTGYGYIRRGPALDRGLFAAAEFREKPDAATAAQYVASGEFYWNSGMFLWSVPTILEQFRRHLPETLEQLQRVTRATPGSARDVVLRDVYPGLHKISIDYGIMEKAGRVLVRELDCQWLDVGSWTALAEILGADAQGQVLAHSQVVSLDSAGNMIIGEDDHLIALVGVRDLVVVRSPDATLICHRDQVQHIKDLVGRLDPRYT